MLLLICWARWGGGVEIDEVGYQSVLVQLLGGAQDVQGGAHGPAGDVPVVDGQDGDGGVPMSWTRVSQVEPNISAMPRAVRSRNSKASSRSIATAPFQQTINLILTGRRGKSKNDLQMERELVYWEKKGGIVTCQCQPRRPGGRPWPRRWRRPWNR